MRKQKIDLLSKTNILSDQSVGLVAKIHDRYQYKKYKHVIRETSKLAISRVFIAYYIVLLGYNTWLFRNTDKFYFPRIGLVIHTQNIIMFYK